MEIVTIPDLIISNEEVSSVVKISNSNKNQSVNTNISYVKPSYNGTTGSNLVDYATRFVGLRYVSAGNSLTTGTDCSGFTKLIYQEFGITLGRTVGSQIYSGTYVSRNDLEPGDLIFYSYGSVASHVAIYMGNGLIIHESNPRDGVKISSMNIMNYITARRLITSSVKSNVVEEVKHEVKYEVKQEKIVEEQTQVPNVQVEEVSKEVVPSEEINQEIPEVAEEVKIEENNDGNQEDTTSIVEVQEDVVDEGNISSEITNENSLS